MRFDPAVKTEFVILAGTDIGIAVPAPLIFALGIGAYMDPARHYAIGMVGNAQPIRGRGRHFTVGILPVISLQTGFIGNALSHDIGPGRDNGTGHMGGVITRAARCIALRYPCAEFLVRG